MKKRIIAVAAVFLTAGILAALAAAQYRNSHIFVGDEVYDRNTSVLDLRGTEISVERYEALRAALPDCEILWDIPFQGSFYPEDTQELTISRLTDEDMAILAHFPNLRHVDATECRDYDRLLALQAQLPACQVDYQVVLGQEAYPKDTASLVFSQADGAELLEKLRYLPGLKTVHFLQPEIPVETLLALRSRYPEVSFTWEKDVFGVTYGDDVTEFDFSGQALDLAELEPLMAYFPSLEKVVLCDCGIDNETMAAYRERAREHYQVVWSVAVGNFTVRTDETTFMPTREKHFVVEGQLGNLVYCEDMIVVDVGHKPIKNLDWLYGMPHLQFLVLADTRVSDITPIGSLKELIYLELFKSPAIHDYSPLTGCTALQDVNVAYTNGDAAVFAQMPWLKHLWVNCTNITPEARQLLTESLPDTVIEFDAGWHMGNGWRDLDNYYIMRDLLGMPYYDWGSKRLTGG
ncbi:MAG: leucine-rich repeat domain-containing protein [Firmicutes bacterium]|nr:leucine-rich repeat domain-containing protein [Bacillota bacterium]